MAEGAGPAGLPPSSQCLLGTPALLGEPTQPFVVRFNLTFARTDELLDYIAVAFAAFGWLRFRPFLYPAANAWMAAHLIAPLINIAWRRHSMAKHPADGGSWARWREVLSAFVRGTALAGGIPYRLVLATFDADSTAAGGPRFDKTAGLLTAAVHFANVSTAPTIAMLWFKPLRFGWALPLQLVTMLADCTRFVGALCRHPFMDFPTLQPLLHATTRVVHMAARVLHPMLPWHATPPDSTAECASGLILLQLSAFGLAAIFKARQEHRLFAQHQWQRLRAGLEPERGFHARVYSAAAALLEPGRGELLWAGALLVIFHHAVITVMLHAHLL